MEDYFVHIILVAVVVECWYLLVTLATMLQSIIVWLSKLNITPGTYFQSDITHM